MSTVRLNLQNPVEGDNSGLIPEFTSQSSERTIGLDRPSNFILSYQIVQKNEQKL